MVNPFMPGDRDLARTRPVSFGQTVSYKTSFYTSKDFHSRFSVFTFLD